MGGVVGGEVSWVVRLEMKLGGTLCEVGVEVR